MPLIATRGAASAQGFGEFAQVTAANYIEDVFSTYLYTGNGSTQTITNGIDLSTKGGLVWIRRRGSATDHHLEDTVRGATKYLISNTTNAEQTNANAITAFNSTGFSLGSYADVNSNAGSFVSWTFRKQPKFFDVVTYTGNGSSITVPHSLGSAPGCIIVKRTNTTGDWPVYHRSVPSNCGFLNYANAFSSAQRFSSVTSTDFTINVSTADVNASGSTYVAYLFAHDAGGFGLTGTDNVISCGSYTGDGSTDGSYLVSLGYEPQWVLVKRTDSSTNGGWHMIDVMRGMPTATSSASITALLLANTSAAEVLDSTGGPKATGFSPVASLTNTNAANYIYIAIRRGPMKVPTTGTSVFSPIAYTGDGTNSRVFSSVNFATDMTFWFNRDKVYYSNAASIFDKLRDIPQILYSNLTNAEALYGGNISLSSYGNTNITMGSSAGGGWNYTGLSGLLYAFRRAPSFFDEVCYTGTGSSQNVAHNLAVVPELLIIKRRNSTGGWEAAVPSTTAGSFFVGTSGAPISLDTTNGNGGQTAYAWASNTGTSTYFNPSGVFWNGNVSSGTYVAYLFATCAGVSKVGTYTGTGAAQTINCGFTAGSRFVMIKRTDSTGDWYVWDSARGIIAGNDPYLLLNSTAAEVTNTDYVDTYSAGFEISSTAPAAINANGGTYIFLAIA